MGVHLHGFLNYFLLLYRNNVSPFHTPCQNRLLSGFLVKRCSFMHVFFMIFHVFILACNCTTFEVCILACIWTCPASDVSRLSTDADSRQGWHKSVKQTGGGLFETVRLLDK